jgi:ribonucleotide monophosphatase NagD (HAD superfamily)
MFCLLPPAPLLLVLQPETLDMLRARGKRLIFLTNNSTKSRAGYLAKFSSLGIHVSADEIFASSFAAAAYLSSPSRAFPVRSSGS